jgi:cytochrome c2
MRINSLLFAATLSALAGCSHSSHSALSLSVGDPDRGMASISHYGCGSCHTIPGVSGAHGQVGPPLSGIAGRMYVAGVLPNRPVAMEQWIRDPKSIDEKTAMPNLGVTARDAADITAYLYSLK